MNWTPLTNIHQLDDIDLKSDTKKVLLFKHSTRCNISQTAKSRLERSWTAENEAEVQTYYLDLLTYRSLSNAIAERYGVEHQSPQVLLISKGKCILMQSHLGISVAEIIDAGGG